MNPLAKFSRVSQRIRRFIALSALVAIAAPTLSTAQSVLLHEPDFSGLFTINAVGPTPLLRDAARAWTYFAAGNVEGVAFPSLFRVSDAGLPDTRWRLTATPQITDQYLAPDGTVIVRAYVKNSTVYEQRWYRLQADFSGDVAAVEISNVVDLPPRDHIDLQQNTGLEPRLLPQPDGSIIAFEVAVTPTTATYTLRKRDRSGREQWSHVVGGRTHNIASDAQGNVYLLGETLAVGGKRSDLLRIRADGSIDTAWNPNLGILTYVSAHMRVVTERIVVADTFGGSPPVNRLSTFDLTTGRKLVERYPQYRTGGIAADGTALSAHASGRWALLDTTRNDGSSDRVSAARVGTFGFMQTSVPWRNGYVIGGNFQYWFDGHLYRNLMRVDAAFRPDPTWSPQVDDAVAAMTVDRDGRLVVASNSASGAEARLRRFAANGTPDGSWQPVVRGDVYTLVAASDGVLFVGGAFSAIDNVKTASLARFRADGDLDQAWSGSTWPTFLPVRAGQFGRDGVYRILDAGSDGVVFNWEDGDMNSFSAGLRRVSRSGSGGELSLPKAVAAAPSYTTGGGSTMRDAKTGDIYGIASAWELTVGAERGTALVRMVAPSMNVDPMWTTLAGEYGRQFVGFAYQTDSHVYACRAQSTRELRRFDKATGREDPNWRSDETYLCSASWFERRTDGVTVVSIEQVGALLQYSATARNTPSTVVEFYARDAKRFFMTSRPNEIAQLDAAPASFVRTGMSFAAETALVRTDTDTLHNPICRFYAAAAAGGSNTHFYGRESDCTLLKRFPSLSYEGVDFRAGVPTNGACQTAALPIPVFRLFHNASASNNGNHRYVVSDAQRSEMVAAGWTDEGVALCTSNATDSRRLADVIR